MSAADKDLLTMAIRDLYARVAELRASVAELRAEMEAEARPVEVVRDGNVYRLPGSAE